MHVRRAKCPAAGAVSSNAARDMKREPDPQCFGRASIRACRQIKTARRLVVDVAAKTAPGGGVHPGPGPSTRRAGYGTRRTPTNGVRCVQFLLRNEKPGPCRTGHCQTSAQAAASRVVAVGTLGKTQHGPRGLPRVAPDVAGWHSDRRNERLRVRGSRSCG
jgi:hypothetical protein